MYGTKLGLTSQSQKQRLRYSLDPFLFCKFVTTLCSSPACVFLRCYVSPDSALSSLQASLHRIRSHLALLAVHSSGSGPDQTMRLAPEMPCCNLKRDY